MPSPERTLSSFQVTVFGDWLSDLFFNHEHPNYDGVEPDAVEAELDAAIIKDAEAFAFCLPMTPGEREELVPVLVKDFLDRL